MLATDTYAPPIPSTAAAALYGLSDIPPLSNPHNPGAFFLNPSYTGLLPSASTHRDHMSAEELHLPERREQHNNVFNSYGDFILRHTLTSEIFISLLVQNYSQQPIEDITSGLTIFHKTLDQYETELQTQEVVALHPSFEYDEKEISKVNRLKMASHIEALLTATITNDPVAEKVALDNISFLNWLSANHNRYIFLGFRKIADIYVGNNQISPMPISIGTPDTVLLEFKDDQISPETRKTVTAEIKAIVHASDRNNQSRQSGTFLNELLQQLTHYIENGYVRIIVMDFKQHRVRDPSIPLAEDIEAMDDVRQLRKYYLGLFPYRFAEKGITLSIQGGKRSWRKPDIRPSTTLHQSVLNNLVISILELTPDGYQTIQVTPPKGTIFTHETLGLLNKDARVRATMDSKRTRVAGTARDEGIAQSQFAISEAPSIYEILNNGTLEHKLALVRDSMDAITQANDEEYALYNQTMQSLIRTLDTIRVLISQKLGTPTTMNEWLKFLIAYRIENYHSTESTFLGNNHIDDSQTLAELLKFSNDEQVLMYKKVSTDPNSILYLELMNAWNEITHGEENTRGHSNIYTLLYLVDSINIPEGTDPQIFQEFQTFQSTLNSNRMQFVDQICEQFPVLQYLRGIIQQAVRTQRISLMDFTLLLMFNLHDMDQFRGVVLDQYYDGTIVTQINIPSYPYSITIALPPDSNWAYFFRRTSSGLVPLPGLESIAGGINIREINGGECPINAIKSLMRSFYGFTDKRFINERRLFMRSRELREYELEDYLEIITRKLMTEAEKATGHISAVLRQCHIPPHYMLDTEIALGLKKSDFALAIEEADVDIRTLKGTELAIQLGLATWGSSIWGDGRLFYPNETKLDEKDNPYFTAYGSNGVITYPLRNPRTDAMIGIGLQTLYTPNIAKPEVIKTTKPIQYIPPKFKTNRFTPALIIGEPVVSNFIYTHELLDTLTIHTMLNTFLPYEDVQNYCIIGTFSDHETIANIGFYKSCQFPDSTHFIIPPKSFVGKIIKALPHRTTTKNIDITFWEKARIAFEVQNLPTKGLTKCRNINDLWKYILLHTNGHTRNDRCIWLDPKQEEKAKNIVFELLNISQTVDVA